MSLLSVSLIQQSCFENRDVTVEKTASMIRQAAASGSRLIVLQELHTGPYFCQTEETAQFDRAETIPGDGTAFFGALAAELQIVLVTSLFERRATGLYHNTAVVFETDGSIAGIYRKMHIPDDPGFYEKFYFTPGDMGFNPIKTSVGTLGVLVCWDQWYPEAARLMALAGAEILIYPTAIGWDPADEQAEKDRQVDAWETVQRGHAIANGLPVLAINRVGFEASPDPTASGIRFWGNSFATGPQGELLGKASRDSEEILTVTLDLARCESVRRIWPFLRDRRIDAYQDLNLRFRD
jgi:N-carbamoylputrescine amidase